MTERQYQEKVKKILEKIYSEEVTVQWPPFRGYGRNIYAPVIDIAVGPFAIDARYEDEYTCMLDKTRSFVEHLINKHNQNFKDSEERASFEDILHFNENARCLFCIEVEKNEGRKHCLGNLINASTLGRIGLLVAHSNKVLRVFMRQRVYLRHLMSLGKNSFKTVNALVLSKAQFDECLSRIAKPINR